ncbi:MULTISPECIES: CD3337/EF1877 family mobilome membrane protein [Mammaliicoccus]|uniref:CD3337/EF1877 family mobilome membrane protein n=1 Tax=Mammaliicoccus TaxID=2803850 RepID=UPI001EFB7E21|nr:MULTISPECIES: hypothetical protein [Mammaliicoccus]
MNKIFKVFLLLLILNLSLPLNEIANADEPDDAVVTNGQDAEAGQDQGLKIESKKMGKYKNDNPKYSIETLTYDDIKKMQDAEKEKKEKDKGIKDKIASGIGSIVNVVPNSLDGVKDDTSRAIKNQGLFVMSKASNGLMQWNVIATNFTLNLFAWSNDAPLFNYIISGVEDKIGQIAGIDSGGLTGDGLFGQFLTLILGCVVVVCMYLAFLKHAPIEALKGLLQTVIVLTIALLLVANMGSYLRGVNTITTGVMDELVSFGAGVEGEADMDSTEDVLHRAMVYTPYVNMMFGTDDDSVVSQERVKNLMTTDDSKKRKNLLKEEYNKGNNMVHPDSVSTQILYGIITVIGNSVLGTVVLVIAGAFLVFQLLIVIWAFIAPFALLWACLPGQFPVAYKYLGKLFEPFLYKLGLGILVMVLGILIGVIASINVIDGIVGYCLQLFLIFLVFIVLFLLRHKIMSVFTVTNEGRMLKQLINSNDYIPQTLGAGANAVTNNIPGVNAVTGAIGGGVVYSASQLGSMMGQDEYEPVERKEVQSEMPQLNDYMGEEKSSPEYDTTPLNATGNIGYSGNNNYDEVEQDTNNDQLESISDHIEDTEDIEGIKGSNERIPTEIRTNGSESEGNSIDNKSTDDLPSLNEYIDDEGDSTEHLASIDKIDSMDRESLDDELSGQKGSLKEHAENEMISGATGLDAGKLKDLQADYNEHFQDDAFHRKLRETADTDYENKGYGHGDKEETIEEIERNEDDSFEKINRDEDRLDDENEEK